jgi:hypothetical protein
MNECSSSSQQHICMGIGDVTFNKLLLSVLYGIQIKYVTNILFALSTDTSIHSENK